MNTMTLRIRRSFKQCAMAVTMAVAALLCTAVFAQSNPSPYSTAYRYDEGSRLVGTISPDPDGGGPNKFASVRNTYNAQGLLASVETGELAAWLSDQVLPTNWTGFTVFRKVDYTYDIWGRKLTEQISSGGTPYALSQYSYDSVGRVQCSAQRMNTAVYSSLPASACTLGTAGADGPDRITYQTYDVLSRVTQVQKAYGTPKQINYATYVYPSNAPLQSVTDANGNYTYYTYDSLVRLQNQYLPSKTMAGQYSNTDFEQYSYDGNGNRLTLKRRDNNTITYAYDGLNRVSSETYPTGTLAPVYYTYDLRNLQLTATSGSPTGTGITSAFDGFGQLTSSTANLSGTARTLSYQYDVEGNWTRITHPDGVFFTYAYDGLNRPTTIAENGSTTLVGTVYDNQGRRKTVTRGASVTSTAYLYDPVSRLQALTNDLVGTTNDETRSFAYNAASQVVSRTLSNAAYVYNELPTSTTNYLVNGLNQYIQLNAGSAVSPDYDANGNMVWDGSVIYYYDLLNRMTGASGSKAVNMAYDPKGRLFQTSGGTSGTTQFLYDGDALVAEYDGAGVLRRRYVHGASVDQPLVEYVGSTIGAANRRYLHADHQGSVIATADAGGNALQVNTYSEYGVPATGNTTRFQYTGQIMLPDLGLYYYKARIYNAPLGRFMQTDPIGYQADMDLYTYVGNDPYKFIDPDGRSPVDVGFLVFDTVKLGLALYSGVGVGAAALDVGLSALGVLSPVPGAGQALKGLQAAEHAVEGYRVAGKAREAVTEAKLVAEHGKDAVQREQYLRDATGSIMKGPDGTARRIDHVVIGEGNAIKSVETTSLTASKTSQAAKEQAIRDAGGTFVRDRNTGKLVDFKEVPTVLRREP